MKNVKVKLVKAFTQNPAEGNPAGVILNADKLSSISMLKIASELGYSESAFVLSSSKADFKVRFFTPTQEMNLCGHATIATIHALVEAGYINKVGVMTQETKAGLLDVEYQKDGLIIMTQATPEFFNYKADRKRIAQLLGLKIKEITDWPIEIVSTGTPKLIVPISTLRSLLTIKPDFEAIKQFCIETGARGIYPFTIETQSRNTDFHARQFNPLAGVNEDPITGVAAGALAAYIKKFNLLSKKRFIIEQGFIMNKPGMIFVNIESKVKVGGYAVTFGEKNIYL